MLVLFNVWGERNDLVDFRGGTVWLICGSLILTFMCSHLCVHVQVRLHILLQLDGLAEWMPAMAEQVSAVAP